MKTAPMDNQLAEPQSGGAAHIAPGPGCSPVPPTTDDAATAKPGSTEVVVSASTSVPSEAPDSGATPAASEPGNSDPGPTPAHDGLQSVANQSTGSPAAKLDEQDENTAAHDAVVLAYHLVLKGGTEKVVEMKSQLVLPLALALENMPQTDISFPELVDQILVRPLVTKFRSFLQRRFDAASEAEAKRKAEAEPLPEPPPRRPVIDQALIDKQVAATIEALKPPVPRMPGRDWQDDKAKL